MQSHEVIRRAVQEEGVKAVASRMRVSAALVYKWCEPAATEEDPELSGARNPLDRVAELYSITRDIRLIRHLCNHAGGFFVANPTQQFDKSIDQQIYEHTRRMFRDFSALLDAITASVTDDPYVDLEEAAVIRDKWEDLKAQLETFVVACEQGHYHMKEPISKFKK